MVEIYKTKKNFGINFLITIRLFPKKKVYIGSGSRMWTQTKNQNQFRI
jgi:hypothetical protein